MSRDQEVPIHALPAAAGLAWFMKSLALVREQPARLLFLMVLMQAILGFSQVPLLGILIILAVPGLSAGLLQAFRLVESGQRPPLAVLFVALTSRPRTGRLLALGALMFAAGILTVSLLLGLDRGALDPDLMARIEQGDLDALAALDPAFVYRMAMALAVAVSVTGVLSFLTIPLIWFSGMGVGAALLTGLRAMWLNWKPFGVLGMALGALLVPVALVFGMLFRATGISAGGSLFVLGLLMLALLLFQLAVFGTQYCAHQAIFGRAEGAALSAGGDGDDSQLVA